ncbi:MAG: hypothetical protein ACHQAQ_14150 [Hyphomicrobiales bacterium]
MTFGQHAAAQHELRFCRPVAGIGIPVPAAFLLLFTATLHGSKDLVFGHEPQKKSHVGRVKACPEIREGFRISRHCEFGTGR